MKTSLSRLSIASCPCCGAGELESMPGGENVFLRAFESEVTIEFAACCSCGFLFQSKPLDQASLMQYYAASAQRRTRELEPIDHEVFQQQLAFMALELGEGPQRVLEIGADTGTFLDCVAERWVCETYFDEANEEACNILSATSHRDVHSYPQVVADGIDVIILRHILEHIPEPKTWLESLHNNLSGDGLLFVEVPDWTLLDEETGFVSFEHVSYFTQSSLSQLLWRAGYGVVRQELALNPTYPNARHRVLRILAKPHGKAVRGKWNHAMAEHIHRGKGAKYDAIDSLYDDSSADPKPALYGASWLADQILKNTVLGNGRVAAIFDIDEKKHGTHLHGVPILAPTEIDRVAPSSLLIASSSEEPIKNYLDQLGYQGRVRTWTDLSST